MRTIIGEVFNDFVYGTTTVYTGDQYAEALGAPDTLAFQVISDQVSGTTPKITVRVTHSGDLRNWANRSTTAEVNDETLTAGTVNSVVGFDASANPCLGSRRLAITLSGTSPAARVRIVATGRDSG